MLMRNYLRWNFKKLTGGIKSDGPWNMYSLDELHKDQKEKHEHKVPKFIVQQIGRPE